MIVNPPFKIRDCSTPFKELFKHPSGDNDCFVSHQGVFFLMPLFG
jgi:hypothetical protein